MRRRPHGTVAYTDGMALANVDSVDIVVKGKGGHGSAPHTTIDPVVLAARIVLDLQTIVSRETNPLDPAVVTVGSIHGGTKHNIIPDEVQAAADRADDQGRHAQAHAGGDRTHRQGRGGRRRSAGADGQGRSRRVHAGAGQRQQADETDDRRVARKCWARTRFWNGRW